MSAYLSVDLDYWLNYNTSLATYQDFNEDIEVFFDRVASLKLSPLVVYEHHGLLDHINSSGWERILQVDFHSDLADVCGNEPTEGDFLGFVKNRREMEYHWFLPNYQVCHVERDGHCDHRNLFGKGGDLYRRLAVHRGTRRLPWSMVTRVGISLSPQWVTYGAAEPMIEKHLYGWAEAGVRRLIEKWRDNYYSRHALDVRESGVP